MLNQLPPGLREEAAHIAPRLLPHGPSTPGYFDVIANSINIMQDYITRARLAGEPPHVMLVPRLRHIGLMEFNRAEEAIAEGRLCVEQALPMEQASSRGGQVPGMGSSQGSRRSKRARIRGLIMVSR